MHGHDTGHILLVRQTMEVVAVLFSSSTEVAAFSPLMLLIPVGLADLPSPSYPHPRGMVLTTRVVSKGDVWLGVGWQGVACIIYRLHVVRWIKGDGTRVDIVLYSSGSGRLVHGTSGSSSLFTLY